MTTKIIGKGQAVAFAKQLIAGTNEHVTGATQVTFLGSTYTAAQITGQLQALVTLRSDVDAAKATARAKLAAERASMPSLRAFMGAYVAYLKAVYGNSPEALADFGINPKARAPLSAEAKAAAAVKRKATRAARHTMGSIQKKGIKGDVSGIVVTPITVSPSVSPSAPQAGSPAAPATNGSTPAATTPRTA